MAGINFVILKINGIDVTNIPHEEAVQIFLKADEPILVEVKRRLNDSQQQQSISKDLSSPSHEFSDKSTDCQSDDSKILGQYKQIKEFKQYEETQISPLLESHNSELKMIHQHHQISNSNDNTASNYNTGKINQNNYKDNTVLSSCCKNDKYYVSTGVQTDMFTSELIFNNSSIDDQTNEDNIFEECITSEIDIEEITLRKSASSERLGLTVKYSSGNLSGSDDTDTCTEVYISDIFPDSVAARDGRLRQGDQILQVNGRYVSNKEETESLIAENKNAVTLLVSRCLYADDDFNESGEFYEDEEQHTAYENYSIQKQYIINSNYPLDNYAKEDISINQPSIKSTSSPSPKHTLPSVIHQQQKQQQELLQSVVPNISDPLYHSNIKTHLESVNHEIALLNSRVENMMLHKHNKKSFSSSNDQQQHLVHNQNLSNVYRVPLDSVPSPSTQITTIDNPINRENDKLLQHPGGTQHQQHHRIIIDSETEHIYETIPESSESEPFYCSPYESSDQNIVEKWLETQQDDILQSSDKKRIQQIKLNNKHHNTIWQKSSTKSNSSGDDRENSSSAYNTGGSCNSNNQLTLELNSNDDPRDKDMMRSTLTLCPPQKSTDTLDNKLAFQQDLNEYCKHCTRQKKEKNSPKKPVQFLVPQQTLQQASQYTTNTISGSYQPGKIRSSEHVIESNCSTLRANNDTVKLSGKTPQTLVNNTSGQIPTDTMYTNRANLQQTMMLQQKLFRQALLQQSQHNITTNTPIRTPFTAPNLSQYYFVSSQEVATNSKPIDNEVKMEWKVKRRQDGTRYIVRRPIRNRILRDRAIKISEERNECTTEDDTISEIKTGRYWTKEERKKHIERAKERRNRQQLIILNKNGGSFPITSTTNTLCNTTNSGNITISNMTQATSCHQTTQIKSLRQGSTRNSILQQDANNTLHKKMVKRKSNKDENIEITTAAAAAATTTTTPTVKQVAQSSGNCSSGKMAGFLSVTTV